MLRLVLLLCFNGLLSAAVVAVTVTRSLALIAKVEQVLENPRGRGAVAAVWMTAIQVCIALVICGAVTWRIARQVPFSL